jgi:hypothetical protein
MKNVGEQFVWWYGVVEDRGDPLQLGRVRVRCYGWHTDNKNELPTVDLPWAQPIQDITSSAMGDVGRSATGIVEGTWVVGFFADGEEGQRPVVMGTMGGFPTHAGDPSKGFNDPNARTEENGYDPDQDYVSIYPRGITTPADNYSEANEVFKTDPDGEEENDRIRPDTNRLARNAGHPVLGAKDGSATSNILIPFWDPDEPFYVKSENEDDSGNDIIGNIKNGNKSHSVDASGTVDSINPNVNATKWNEPKTTDPSSQKTEDDEPIPRYNTAYPKNHVFESESGHIKEYDDTPKATRIHEYHRSGTFYEIDHDGNKQTRVVGNNYEVIAGTNFVNIKGDVNLTIESNCKTYIKGDWDIQVDGNKTELIKGSYNEHINGNHGEHVDGNQTSTIKKTVVEVYGEPTQIDSYIHNQTVYGPQEKGISGKKTTAVTKDVVESYANNQYTTASKNIEIKGKRIDMNKS